MKALLVSLTLLLSAETFANKYFLSKADWDRPLETKAKMFMPSIDVTPITIIDATHVVVRFILTGPDFTRIWRALMEANAMEWTGTRFQPVVFHWEFDVPAGYTVYDFYVTLPRPTSWVTWPASPEAVADDQFYVYEFFPIN